MLSDPMLHKPAEVPPLTGQLLWRAMREHPDHGIHISHTHARMRFFLHG